MAIISFVKNFKSIEVTSGANLMQSLIQAGLPVASSCYGDGVCSKCRMQIVQGAENLSTPNDIEKFLCERLRLAKDIRISCQTAVLGDVTVDTTYW